MVDKIKIGNFLRKLRNDPVPDYVLVYEKYESLNSEISGWVIEEEYLQAFFHGGSSIKWDYDGNILFDNR